MASKPVTNVEREVRSIHSYLPLHNNISELNLRRQVVGRHNWLFVGSEVGAEANTTHDLRLFAGQLSNAPAGARQLHPRPVVPAAPLAQEPSARAGARLVAPDPAETRDSAAPGGQPVPTGRARLAVLRRSSPSIPTSFSPLLSRRGRPNGYGAANVAQRHAERHGTSRNVTERHAERHGTSRNVTERHAERHGTSRETSRNVTRNVTERHGTSRNVTRNVTHEWLLSNRCLTGVRASFYARRPKLYPFGGPRG